MDKKRKVYAPFSLTSEAGVAQTPVEGYIDVIQTVFPSVNTGTINENGTWTGVKSSDEEFFNFTKHVAVPDTGETLSPDTGTSNFIDMTGFTSLFIAIKPSNGGNYKITAVMGPDTKRFANLEPVNAAATLRGSIPTQSASGGGVTNELFNDPAESLTADVWNILYIQEVLENQKLMQFKITNNSGGNSDIEIGFMRVI